MTRRLDALTLDNVEDLPKTCRSCVRWELDPLSVAHSEESGDPAFDKEVWLSSTLLEWGSCGRIAYVEGQAVGYVTYAPPAFVPRSLSFPTSPVSADAVLLMTARIEAEYRGQGLARMLVQAAAKDLTRRGVRAIEVFALANGAGAATAEEMSGRCMLPADLLLAVGFKTVAAHHRFPRLRLELKAAVSWREDVEIALERILAGSTLPVLSR